MTKSRLALIVAFSIAVAIVVADSYDFGIFYYAARNVWQGVTPYSVPGYYSPIAVAIVYMPLALLRYDVAVKINIAVMVVVYLIALSRIFKGRWPMIIALVPFSILIARYGNVESLILIGATLPATIGVWLLMLKPQIGLFAAAIMLWRGKHWKTGATVGFMFAVSVWLGMGQSTPIGAGWNVSLFPYGLIVGVPLLVYAWFKRDELSALGAAVFISPYLSLISLIAALPLFRMKNKT